ncbi:MAG: hypothetical protein H6R26_436 [Proteobacteria bacterium]|nr:hypothetical protein [Pseudomonadota bacterium]
MSRPLWCGVLAAMCWPICAAEMADPTRPPPELSTGGVAVAPLPRVTAIVIGKYRRHALLNGKEIVRAGERWADMEVVAIDPGRVTVRRGGQLIELPLVPNVKKSMKKVRRP